MTPSEKAAYQKGRADIAWWAKQNAGTFSRFGSMGATMLADALGRISKSDPSCPDCESLGDRCPIHSELSK